MITTKNIDEIEMLIQEKIPIKLKEKNKYGEVFTPSYFIKDILNKIPDKIWSNPDLKWLDPAGGFGNFSIFIYYKLYESLKFIIPNNKSRQTHILQNMLYNVEINHNNVSLMREILGEKSNIYNCDFLTWEPPDNIHFDVIIGNPPFNALRQFKKKNSATLWDKFVSIILTKYFKNNNFLIFIHPPRWRAIDSTLFEIMARKNSLLHLEMYHFSDGLKIFNSETRFDWYIIKQGSHNLITTIQDINKKIYKINLNNWKWNFIPNFDLLFIEELLNKSENNCFKLLYSRTQFASDKKWTNSIQNSEFKYPLIHSTPKKQIRYYYTNTLHPPVRNNIPMYNIKKIIFGEGGSHNPVIDIEGKYGITESSMAIIINNLYEGEIIYNVLISDKFKNLVKAFNTDYFRINRKIFNYINITFLSKTPLHPSQPLEL